MKLLSIAGFLGSGKTTLMLRVAREFSTRFKPVVILENEIGEIGIDSNYLKKEGLEVQELFGGCICCVMQLDLIVTLEKIQQTIAPEWVLLEPTGAADPGEVEKAVTARASFVDKVKTVVLLDAPRFKMFNNMMSPMITSQIKAADVIAINKIDEVSGDALATIKSTVAEYTNTTDVVSICAEDGTGVDSLLDMIFQND